MKETVCKEIQRTNTLIAEMLKNSGGNLGEILTKEEKLSDISARMRELHERFQSKEIDSEEYNKYYSSLEKEKSWIK